ncbi:cytochrome P450 [Streptomyces pactum]|uniref:Cytochrome P450 n=1 Tax=Streptomyces pactum TaxID=68249 RepID=A0ABS0NER8_9ACTN|nr:cytochrome P450 [Streptomyces pactum]MBH5333647.1 cytochrome P450 [Streptomyces pactum]
MNRAPISLDTTGGRLYDQADELRAAGPAVRVGMPSRLTAWSVTRGDVAKTLLTHPHISKDARRSWPGYQPFAIPWLAAWVDVVSMFTSDGADHKRLKDLVGRAFTPRRIEAMRPAVEAIVTDLLDALEATAPGGSADLRATFSYPIPTRVICNLFGVPDEQRSRMLDVVDAVLDTTVSEERAAEIRVELFAVMSELIATKRVTPGDDMTSVLLAAHREDGDRLSEEELVSTLILMIGAGSETAVSLIDHAVVELLTHPGQLATALADPARWDDVTEETLRKHPPVMHLPLRYATADIDLGEGVTIRSGDLVLIGFGAHGRDGGVNPDPDRFDIDRADRQHLAFGHGIHYCLGAPLARLEARVALPALFARFPRIRLAAPAGTLRRRPSFIGNDYDRLPVVLSPAGDDGVRADGRAARRR